MTIQELLVRDGRWPNTDGPRRGDGKPRMSWTFTVDCKDVKLNQGVLRDFADIGSVEFWLKPKAPTIPCEPDENGVVT